MNRIENLLAAMTVEEKIGQLNMVAAGYAVTGRSWQAGQPRAFAPGVSAVSSTFGSQEIHAMQKIAVEKTRLSIPLLAGFDVLHGHRTIFPIPLAEAASFEPRLWEASARAAAIEAAADGISMTSRPCSISRAIRAGTDREGAGEDPWVVTQFAIAKVRGFQGDGLPEGLASAGAVAARLSISALWRPLRT